VNQALVISLAAVGLVAAITLIVYLANRAVAKRRAGLAAVAQQAGWSITLGTLTPEALGAGAFPLFTHGRARKASHVMRLPDGGPAVAVFDYQYTVGGGQHQSTVTQTVVHVRSGRVSLPPFVLSPENILHKVGGALGYHDIDFDASPEFSKKYLLRSKAAEERVRDLFTPSLRLYFEQRAPLTVEGSEHGLLVYKQGRRVPPDDLVAFVEDARAVARHFEH
jgi:hypothetical protein